MTASTEYYLALLHESMTLSGISLLLRLHLKKVTPEEREKLQARAKFLDERFEELKKPHA